jgi:hypothetical protein
LPAAAGAGRHAGKTRSNDAALIPVQML